MFEEALVYYDRFEVTDGKQHIVENIHQLKVEIGLVQETAAEKVALRRGQLKYLIESDGADSNIVCAKMALAIALCEAEPPQFIEAIQLTKAAFDTSRQVFGPDNDYVVCVKESLDNMTGDYRAYLRQLQ